MAQESWIEGKARIECSRLGGVLSKFVSPGRRGKSDDIAWFPGEVVAVLEFKAPGEKANRLQVYEQNVLRSFGFRVYVVDSLGQAIEILRALKVESDIKLAAAKRWTGETTGE
jgi:hypothetical protein